MLSFIIGFIGGCIISFASRPRFPKIEFFKSDLANQALVVALASGLIGLLGYHLSVSLHYDALSWWHEHGIPPSPARYGTDQLLVGLVAGFFTLKWADAPSRRSSTNAATKTLRATILITLIVSGVFHNEVASLVRGISGVETSVVKLELIAKGDISIDLDEIDPVSRDVTFDEEAGAGRSERQVIFNFDTQLIASNWVHLNKTIIELEKSNAKETHEANKNGVSIRVAELRKQREQLRSMMIHLVQLRWFSEIFVESILLCAEDRARARFNVQADLVALQPLIDNLGDILLDIQSNVDADHERRVLEWIVDMDQLRRRFADTPRDVPTCKTPRYASRQPLASLIAEGYPLSAEAIEKGSLRKDAQIRVGERIFLDEDGGKFDPYKAHFSRDLSMKDAATDGEKQDDRKTDQSDDKRPKGLYLPDLIDAIRRFPHLNLVIAHMNGFTGNPTGAVLWTESAYTFLENTTARLDHSPGNKALLDVFRMRIGLVADRYLLEFDHLKDQRSKYQHIAINSDHRLAESQHAVRQNAIENKLDARSFRLFDVPEGCETDAPLGQYFYVSTMFSLNNALYLAAEDRNRLTRMSEERAFFTRNLDLPCATGLKARSPDSLTYERGAFVDTFGKLLLSDAAATSSDGASGVARTCSLLRKAEEAFKRSIELLSAAADGKPEPAGIEFGGRGTHVRFAVRHTKITQDVLGSC